MGVRGRQGRWFSAPAAPSLLLTHARYEHLCRAGRAVIAPLRPIRASAATVVAWEWADPGTCGRIKNEAAQAGMIGQSATAIVVIRVFWPSWWALSWRDVVPTGGIGATSGLKSTLGDTRKRVPGCAPRNEFRGFLWEYAHSGPGRIVADPTNGCFLVALPPIRPMAAPMVALLPIRPMAAPMVAGDRRRPLRSSAWQAVFMRGAMPLTSPSSVPLVPITSYNRTARTRSIVMSLEVHSPVVGTRIDDLDMPCLLLDLDKVERNMDAMAHAFAGTSVGICPMPKRTSRPGWHRCNSSTAPSVSAAQSGRSRGAGLARDFRHLDHLRVGGTGQYSAAAGPGAHSRDYHRRR